MQEIQISVVVSLLNEVESLPELNSWIAKVMLENNFSYEVIYIDDGSTDDSWKLIQDFSKENESVKGIRFQRNYGKSAALNRGFLAVKGDVVITMDADLQDSPEEIPDLYRMIVEEGYDLVSGWKKKRHDPISKTIPTKLYNAATRKMTGLKLHDMNCGLKAYKKQVVKSVEVYGEMHRYIPAMAKWAGFKNIGEKVVHHQARKYGKSKFGLERFMFGMLDLMSITFMARFQKRPMHFFGTMGVFTFFLGFAFAVYLAAAKVFFSVYKMTDRPLFYFALLAMMIGTMLFLTGFIGELISRNSSDRNKYLISETEGDIELD